jgi:hypothetical protein
VHDSQVSLAFIRVIHLVATPVSLFAPRVFLRVMFRGGRLAAANLALPAGQRARS